MKERHTFYVPHAAETGELPADEARHAVRALRMTKGDTLWLLDGEGQQLEAVVDEVSNKHCSYRIVATQHMQRTWTGYVHLAIAPTKHIDRIEWLLEKATEIGIDEVTFLRCRFSERTTLRLDRMRNIVVAAMKQSRNAYLPKINDMMPYGQFVQQQVAQTLTHGNDSATFIAHCYNEQPRQDLHRWLGEHPQCQRLTLMVGPEGDFATDEVESAVQHGILPVTLGESRLRTETAALVGHMMMNLHNRITHA
ncbi:MAG: 16S rRNA (uracil(1498)-N(3))-methyltransferase [Bacteroidaceae bacterium]|nr:16S rRNA (uracil(1498)-N(3))-methyltransferase [Bacteroidaceae bacterium]